jgi:hypothetical protein
MKAMAHIYMTYSFLPQFWGRGVWLEIAVDILRRFPANCLYGDWT